MFLMLIVKAIINQHNFARGSEPWDVLHIALC